MLNLIIVWCILDLHIKNIYDIYIFLFECPFCFLFLLFEQSWTCFLASSPENNMTFVQVALNEQILYQFLFRVDKPWNYNVTLHKPRLKKVIILTVTIIAIAIEFLPALHLDMNGAYWSQMCFVESLLLKRWSIHNCDFKHCTSYFIWSVLFVKENMGGFFDKLFAFLWNGCLCDHFIFHSFLCALSVGLSLFNVTLFFLPLLLTISNVTSGDFVHLVLPCHTFDVFVPVITFLKFSFIFAMIL